MDNATPPQPTGARMRDLKGIAEYTGFPESYLRHLVRNKGIPVTKFGGRLWFDTIEIDRWIARNTRLPERAA